MRRRRSSEAFGCPSVGVDIRSDHANNGEIKERAMNETTVPETPLAVSPPKAGGPRPTTALTQYRLLYFLHSALVLAVVVLGMMHNGGSRKYIPVNPKELSNLVSSQIPHVSSEMGTCRKAYVNVHSSAIEEDGAAFCCPDSDYSSSFREENQYRSNLCHPRIPVIGVSTEQLPFARRLTRLTEAWVLPLLPIIIRLIYLVAVQVYSFLGTFGKGRDRGNVALQREATSLSTSHASSSSSLSSDTAPLLDTTIDKGSTSVETIQPHDSNHNSVRITLQRFMFYFMLLNFRGWGLYIGANALEDYVILPWLTGNTVVSPMRTNSMSDVEHDLKFSGNDPQCWYKDVLKAHHKSAMESGGHSDCYGRPFDFSDHVVLFLAHYLPVFLMEILVYYSFPFWNANAAFPKQRPKTRLAWDILHVVLILYLHLIVLHSLYQTAVYFHTPGEILVGYGVSLMIQLPATYLMCAKEPLRWKKYLGLPSGGGESMNDKGD